MTIQLDFLKAHDGTPIVKTFSQDQGTIQSQSYPMVAYFDGTRETASDIEEFYEHVQTYAAQGAALMKGNLSRLPENGRRSGLTNPNDKTLWVELDNDFSSGWPNLKAFLTELDPIFENLTYIVNHSASAGITHPAGLRTHVLFTLPEPVMPSVLKLWLLHKNFTVPELRNRITLGGNKTCLRFPLDITTCQNDKLLFIAPPRLYGLTDSLAGRRTEIVHGSELWADLDFSDIDAQTLLTQQTELINELRRAEGLRRKTPRTGSHAGVEVVTNPDKVTITDYKEERGFIYFNLNDGDSWGYYTPADNPEILYNFKGEPNVRLKDVAPEMYQQFKPSKQKNPAPKVTTPANLKPLVVRNIATDGYLSLLVNTDDGSVVANKLGNLQKCEHFMKEHGALMPEVVESWTVEFDPTTLQQIDEDRKWINTFKPPVHMLEDLPYTTEVPTVTHKVIWHAVGNDAEMYHWVMNWLACIYQTRRKNGTSIILSGIQGTGKGIILNKILPALFGEDYVKPLLTSDLNDRFNDFVLDTLITGFDEFHIENDKRNAGIIDKLKNLITEPTLPVRRMQISSTKLKVFNNTIINTNHHGPIPIDRTDRRMALCPRQEKPLLIDEEELDQIFLETRALAAYLQHYTIDPTLARRAPHNQTREEAIKASQTTHDDFFNALRESDLDYFLQFIEGPTLQVEGSPHVKYTEYFNAVSRWASEYPNTVKVPRSELEAAYAFLQGNRPSATKFTRMCNINGLKVELQRDGGSRFRGLAIDWHVKDPKTINEIIQPTKLEGTAEVRAEVLSHPSGGLHDSSPSQYKN